MTTARYAAAKAVKRLNLLAYIIQHAISEWDIAIINDVNERVIETINNPRYPLELFLRVLTYIALKKRHETGL